MDGTVAHVLVVLGATLGLGFVALVAVVLWAKLQTLPPAVPPAPLRRDRTQEEALLVVPEWRKRAVRAPNDLLYERPLDIVEGPGALPDEAVLPPPRAVEGRNGEV